MGESPPTAHPWLPYVAPVVAFLALTSLEGYVPKQGEGPNSTWYTLAYTAKVVVVAAVALACRSAWRDLRPMPGPRTLAVAVGLGLVVALFWVGLDPYYPR